MENHVYVLEAKDFFGGKMYYQGNWQDTSDISNAKSYTLDEALAVSRNLKNFGGHYVVQRVNN